MSSFSLTPKEIAAALKAKDMNLLVGSGASCSCGFPSWERLIGDMKSLLRRRCTAAERSDLDQFLRNNSYPRIADHFRRIVGDAEYYRFLRSRFRHKSNGLSSLLQSVAKLPVRTVFTTNYDKLLELAFRGAKHEDPVVVIDPKQLSAILPNELQIIKLHGDIDHPESIVLTEEDYTRVEYDYRYKATAQFFQGKLAFSRMLVVGFGLRDPHFDRIHANVLDMLGKNSPRVISLMAKQNRFDVQHWESRNIDIVPFSDYADLERFLGEVANAC